MKISRALLYSLISLHLLVPTVESMETEEGSFSSSSMILLPPELKQEILSYLKTKEALALGSTCTAWWEQYEEKFPLSFHIVNDAFENESLPILTSENIQAFFGKIIRPRTVFLKIEGERSTASYLKNWPKDRLKLFTLVSHHCPTTAWSSIAAALGTFVNLQELVLRSPPDLSILPILPNLRQLEVYMDSITLPELHTFSSRLLHLSQLKKLYLTLCCIPGFQYCTLPIALESLTEFFRRTPTLEDLSLALNFMLPSTFISQFKEAIKSNKSIKKISLKFHYLGNCPDQVKVLAEGIQENTCIEEFTYDFGFASEDHTILPILKSALTIPSLKSLRLTTLYTEVDQWEKERIFESMIRLQKVNLTLLNDKCRKIIKPLLEALKKSENLTHLTLDQFELKFLCPENRQNMLDFLKSRKNFQQLKLGESILSAEAALKEFSLPNSSRSHPPLNS